MSRGIPFAGGAALCFAYNALGQRTQKTSSGGFTGITTSNSYNNRLFPTTITASSSNGTALSLSYS